MRKRRRRRMRRRLHQPKDRRRAGPHGFTLKEGNVTWIDRRDERRTKRAAFFNSGRTKDKTKQLTTAVGETTLKANITKSSTVTIPMAW